MGKGLEQERSHSKADDKELKRPSTSLVVREMQMKTASEWLKARTEGCEEGNRGLAEWELSAMAP